MFLSRLRSLGTLLLATAATAGAAPPVTIMQDDKVFTLSNGSLTAQVNKTNGDLTSLKFKGLETMGYTSGHHNTSTFVFYRSPGKFQIACLPY